MLNRFTTLVRHHDATLCTDMALNRSTNQGANDDQGDGGQRSSDAPGGYSKKFSRLSKYQEGIVRQTFKEAMKAGVFDLQSAEDVRKRKDHTERRAQKAKESLRRKINGLEYMDHDDDAMSNLHDALQTCAAFGDRVHDVQKTELSDTRGRVKELEARLEASCGQVSELTQTKDALIAQSKAEQTKGAQLQTDLTDLQRRLREAQDKEKQVQSQIQTTAKEQAALSAELEETKAKLSGLKKDSEKAQATIASLQGQRDAQVQNLEHKVDGLEAERQRLNLEEDEAKRLRRENVDLVHQLNLVAFEWELSKAAVKVAADIADGDFKRLQLESSVVNQVSREDQATLKAQISEQAEAQRGLEHRLRAKQTEVMIVELARDEALYDANAWQTKHADTQARFEDQLRSKDAEIAKLKADLQTANQKLSEAPEHLATAYNRGERECLKSLIDCHGDQQPRPFGPKLQSKSEDNWPFTVHLNLFKGKLSGCEKERQALQAKVESSNHKLAQLMDLSIRVHDRAMDDRAELAITRGQLDTLQANWNALVQAIPQRAVIEELLEEAQQESFRQQQRMEEDDELFDA